MSRTLDTLSAAEIPGLIAQGELTARQVAEAALDAVEQRDGDVHAFLQVTPEMALAAADKIDAAKQAGQDLPALAGVPVAFKDNMNLVGTDTTCASKMLEGYHSVYTATCVQRMLDAGALPLGKLNMDEFAFGSSTETSYFGPSKNPHDLERVPGGSSGGSSAAVSAGEALVTLGSDTGGSIRQPAAFCGVVGFKPTYGVVSRYGVVAFGSSLDQVGPFAKTVEDVALTMNVLCGRDEKDCTSQECTTSYTANLKAGVKGKKVGIVKSMIEAEGVVPEVQNAIMQAAENLKSQGAELVEVELPNARSAMGAYYVIGPCEAFSNLSRFDSVRYGYRAPGAKSLDEQESLSRAEGFGAEVCRRIMLGSYLLSSGVYEQYYYPAQQVRTLITQDYANAFEQCDTILMPTTPRAAFKFGEITDPTEMYLSDMFTVSINIAGNGGISVPVGFGKDSGLPIGAQLIGPAFRDPELLQVAYALEQCYEPVSVAPGFAQRGGVL